MSKKPFDTLDHVIKNSIACTTFNITIDKKGAKGGFKEWKNPSKRVIDRTHTALAILTGKPNKIVVIDIDFGKGKNVSPALIATFKDNCSAIESTPCGGYHFYYKQDDRTATLQNSAGSRINGVETPGVDIRANGGIIICSPTSYEKGSYTWIHGNLSTISDMPDVIYAIICDNLKKRKSKNKPFPNHISHTYIDATDEPVLSDELTTIVNMIGSDSASYYQSWYQVCRAIGGVSGGRATSVAIEFANKSTRDNIDLAATVALCESADASIGIGTLYYYAKQDSPEAYETYMRKKKENKILASLAVIDKTEFDAFEPSGEISETPWIKYTRDQLTRGDVGLANIFAEHFKGTIVYVSHIPDTWYVFNKKSVLWEEVPDMVIAYIFCENMRLIIQPIIDYINYQKIKANDTQKEKLNSELKTIDEIITQTYRKTYAVNCIKLASASPLIKNYDFTKQLNTIPHLLSVQNGTVNLRTGELRARRHDDYFTYALEHEYKPDAITTDWQQYFKSLFRDEETVLYIKWLLGYCLTGEQSAGILPILYGDGHNGKSILIEFVKKILGPTLFATLNKRDFSGKDKNMDSLYYAMHARVATLNESGKMSFDEEMLKQLTSSTDSISLQAKFKSSIETKMQIKLMIITNHKPVFSTDTNSMWDRVRLIPFTVRFAYPEDDEWDEELAATGEIAKKDPEFIKSLGENMEGLLAWMVEGAKTFYTEREKVPTSVKVANKEYKHECNPVGEWLSENIEASESENLASSELFAAYSSKTGTSQKTSKQLVAHLSAGMKSMGFKECRFYNAAKKQVRGYINCRMKKTIIDTEEVIV